MTDVTLATGMPSITARSAGMVMPVGRSIAELFESLPGPTAPRLGRYLLAAMYQGSAVACAMFLTGQASNVLAAGLAVKLAGVEVTWSGWLVAALRAGTGVVPRRAVGGAQMVPPEVTRTPEATAFAARELAVLGRIGRDEGITLAVFVGRRPAVADHRLAPPRRDVRRAARAVGAAADRHAHWPHVIAERSAWDVFIWYGGLLKMGELLNGTGVTTAFATASAGCSAGWAGSPCWC